MNKLAKLKDVASLTVGFVGNMTKEYVNSGIVFFRSLNIKPFYIDTKELLHISHEFNEKIKKSKLKEGDVVIVRTGQPGACCVIPKEYDGCNCSDLVIVRPNKEKVNPYFLEAYINFMTQKQINNHQVGAIQKHFNVASAKEMILYLPELPIQKKCAKIVNIINNKIKVNNKINAELESMAKTIYDYWFLQFEFPNEDGRPYKSSGGKMVWNEELKREIPEGWKKGTLEDVGEIVAGGTPSTEHPEYYCKNGIAWITPNDLSNSNDKYISHGDRDISDIGLINSSAKLMPKGTVLLTSRAPIGYIGIAINEVCTNQGFKSIVPNKKFGSEFIYYTIQKMIEYLKSLGTGSTFTEISKNVVAQVKIVLPEESVVNEFEKITSEISGQRRILEEENRELISLRDFLLPLLMNGQVSFKD